MHDGLAGTHGVVGGPPKRSVGGAWRRRWWLPLLLVVFAFLYSLCHRLLLRGDAEDGGGGTEGRRPREGIGLPDDDAHVSDSWRQRTRWCHDEGVDALRPRVTCDGLPRGLRLVLQLDIRDEGGIGNLRSAVLDFMLLAVLLGADVVTPMLPLRSGGVSGSMHRVPSFTSLATFFDINHFREAWQLLCPRMQVYGSGVLGGAPLPHLNVNTTLVTRRQNSIAVNSMHAADPLSAVHADDISSAAAVVAQRLRQFQEAFCNLVLPARAVDATHVAIWTHKAPGARLWDFNLRTVVPSDVRHPIGLSLRSHKDARAVARALVTAMRRFIKQLNATGRLCGAHMRSESDMAHMLDLSNGTRQGLLFLEAARAARCRVLYVGGGTPKDIDRMALALVTTHARSPIDPIRSRLIILSREWLLGTAHPADQSARPSVRNAQGLAATIGPWSWDKRALVDYEVLAHVDSLWGASISSFSWNLAIRRWFARHCPHVNDDSGSGSGGRSYGRNASSSRRCTDASAMRNHRHRRGGVAYDDGATTLLLGLGETATPIHLEHRATSGMWP